MKKDYIIPQIEVITLQQGLSLLAESYHGAAGAPELLIEDDGLSVDPLGGLLGIPML